jgi:hypothetical protein
MKQIQINYENLLEWMTLNHQTRQSMAQTASDLGAPISAVSLGKHLRQGNAMPSTVIVAWQEAFGWDWEMTAHLVLNGAMPSMKEQECTRKAEAALASIADALRPYLN